MAKQKEKETIVSQEDIEKRIKNCEASEIVHENMGIYTDDVVSNKYPHLIDGLKKVQRYILWVVGNEPGSCEANEVIAKAAKYHTGGDSSVAEAMFRLVQPFQIGHPLIHIEGKSGDYSDSNGAAARYIESKITEFGKDVFFNRCVKKALPLKPNKHFTDVEPIYLIPCIPMTLLINHLTIGIGYRSQTPQLNINNVCELVMAMSELRSKSFKQYLTPQFMAKYLIPDYPVDNYLANREMLYQAYKEGNYNVGIEMLGKFTIKDNELIIRSVAVPNDYLGTYERVTEEITKSKTKHWLQDYIKGYANTSATEPAVTITFKNNISLFPHLHNIRIMFNMSEYIYPKYYYVFNDKLLRYYPPQLLSVWYDERKRSILSGIKYKHTQLAYNRLEKQALLLICDDSDTVINIIKNSTDKDNAAKTLYKQYPKLTLSQAHILCNAPLITLAKLSKQNLEESIEQIDASIKDILTQYSTIDQTIYMDAQFIIKKYGTKRITTFLENQMGYAVVGNDGIIQFEDLDDMYTLLSNNPKIQKLCTYHSHLPNKKPYHTKKELKFKHQNIPKEFCGTDILEYPNKPMTFCRNAEGSCALIEGVKVTTDDTIFVQYITENGFGITLGGNVIQLTPTQITNRKKIARGSKTNIIGALPSTCRDMVVMHMHPMEPNVLRMDHILNNPPKDFGKCIFTPTDDLVIIDIQPLTTKTIVITLPENCLYKNTARYMVIENIKALFKESNHVLLPLTKANTSLKKHSIHSKVLLLTGKDTSK